MKTTSTRLLTLSALVVTLTVTISAGGWSVITLREFPAAAVVAEPLTLTFAVRQHGVTLVDGLSPLVRASAAGGAAVEVRATPSTRRGEYTATLGFPAAGEWTIRVDGGFNPADTARLHNAVTLPSLTVVRHRSEIRPGDSDAERGERLFTAKGCVGCHQAGNTRDLANKRFPLDYLKTLLADPGARTADMPNLDLSEREISALAAFVNRSKT